MPQFDPLAPLGSWDIEVELAGQTWTIPAAPAADWAAPIIAGQAQFVIPEMFAEDPAPIEDALFEGELSWLEVESAYHDAMESVSGVRWWEAQRLMALALDWDGIGGELLLQGVLLEERTVAQVCVAVWRIATRKADQKDLNKIRHEIEKPPPGMDYEEAIDDEENMKAFSSIPSDLTGEHAFPVG